MLAMGHSWGVVNRWREGYAHALPVASGLLADPCLILQTGCHGRAGGHGAATQCAMAPSDLHPGEASNVRYLPDVSPVELRQSELVDLVSRFAPHDGLHQTSIGALQLIRASQPALRLPTVYQPGIALVVQGRKQAMAMGEVLAYDPLHCLV